MAAVTEVYTRKAQPRVQGLTHRVPSRTTSGTGEAKSVCDSGASGTGRRAELRWRRAKWTTATAAAARTASPRGSIRSRLSRISHRRTGVRDPQYRTISRRTQRAVPRCCPSGERTRSIGRQDCRQCDERAGRYARRRCAAPDSEQTSEECEEQSMLSLAHTGGHPGGGHSCGEFGLE